ncbi:MAG: AAA family ATPase [Alphaproteobacteria bacterium]|nr:AAA family ATPase [Alphaproteobacteria bacterium]MBT7942721.1 AAA family ATPase [Alphaproteobacteria bacterium]
MSFFSKNKNEKKAAHVIVVGNEKGGSGKSTTAMHLAIGLLQRGYSVASIDVDYRQGTFSRYLANRRNFIKAAGSDIKMPDPYTIAPPTEEGAQDQSRPGADAEQLRLLLEGSLINHDIVVVDTPGSAGELSSLAHSYADTLVTPINDSFVDLDVLAHIDGARMAVMGPSQYSEMVWTQKKVRAERDGGSIDWVIMRNRLSSLDAHNKRQMEEVLRDLAARIGVRVVPGLGERVIFRELFLAGLTILDLKDAVGPQALSPSHLAAREEVTDLINAINLPGAPGVSLDAGAG